MIYLSTQKKQTYASDSQKLFYNGIAEIKKHGFSKPDMNLKVKALLYSALVRSKLVYGFECSDLKRDGQTVLLREYPNKKQLSIK